MKLNNRYRLKVPLTHYNKLLAQKNKKWSQLSQLAIGNTQYGFEFLTKSNRFIVNSYPFKKVRTNYKVSHQAVQEFKVFYGNIKEHLLVLILSIRAKNYRKGLSLIILIESYLCVALWRRYLLPTIDRAYQKIHHETVIVNGTVVKSPFYKLKVGDLIQINVKQVRYEPFNYLRPPPHLEVSLKTSRFVFNYQPLANEIRWPFPIDIGQVRKFYRKG